MSRREGMLRSLLTLAASDGKVAGQELHLITLLSAKWGIESDLLYECVADAEAGKRPVVVPQSDTERRELFQALVDVTVADGVVAPQERAILDAVSKRLGLDGSTVDELLAKAQESPTGPASLANGFPARVSPSSGSGSERRASARALAQTHAEREKKIREILVYTLAVGIPLVFTVLLVRGIARSVPAAPSPTPSARTASARPVSTGRRLSENRYMDLAAGKIETLGKCCQAVHDLMEKPTFNKRWRFEMAVNIAALRKIHADLGRVSPPGGWDSAHARLLNATRLVSLATHDLESSISRGDASVLPEFSRKTEEAKSELLAFSREAKRLR